MPFWTELQDHLGVARDVVKYEYWYTGTATGKTYKVSHKFNVMTSVIPVYMKPDKIYLLT